MRRSLPLALITLALLVLAWLLVWQQPTPDKEQAAFPTTLEKVSAATPRQRQMDIRSWQTEAGSRVLFMPSPQLPMLDVRLVFNAGSARDEIAGTASLTNTLLDQGADGLDVDTIAAGFEDLGARFSSDSHRDMAIANLTTLTESEFLDPAVALFARVLSQPSFPEDALNRMRHRYLQGLMMQQQVPGPQVGRAWNEVLFGDHPYGIPSSGDEGSLPRIERQHLLDFHRRYYTGANAVIAIVGDISEEQARDISEQLSAALPEGEPAPALDDAATLAERHTRHIDFETTQTHIHIGNQLIKRGHPDRVALHVGNHILGGGGFASTLMEEVRQQRGLVYGISSSISPMAAAGPFRVQLQTANDNADGALALTLSLIEDWVEQGPSEEQVQKAIDYLTGSFALSTASNRDIVGQLGAMAFYDLPLDYMEDFQRQVREMTPEKIHDALRRHLVPEHLAIVSIGPRAPRLPGDEPDPEELDDRE